jgi:hypothetical protein
VYESSSYLAFTLMMMMIPYCFFPFINDLDARIMQAEDMLSPSP